MDIRSKALTECRSVIDSAESRFFCDSWGVNLSLVLPTTKWCRWIPPDLGQWAINSEGSLHDDGASFGVVICDCNRAPVVILVGGCSCESILMVELHGIRASLRAALDKELNRVSVRFDSLLAIQCINHYGMTKGNVEIGRKDGGYWEPKVEIGRKDGVWVDKDEVDRGKHWKQFLQILILSVSPRMASNGGGGTEEEQQQQLALLGKTLKEGERILAATRRPDGTLRKPIRIRAGYVPQDEVAIYQPKGALIRKGMAGQEVPPGYDPVLDAKPKTKAAKRNERKKEKKLQVALDKEKNLESTVAAEVKTGELLSAEDAGHRLDAEESLACQMNMLSVSANPSVGTPSLDSTESSNRGGSGPDIDKRIRSLKKKIRLTEAQQQKSEQEDMNPEQLDKVRKLESWRNELKLLENKKAELAAS
ncbi:hypothetical protein HHK36_007837 [Tetracentron sinense]|uniref:WIBG Mago-binding domain-containing protein n=1 Tax=Tetracentron sinense TaxID=13715 RepID=A0A834ZI01_TETSI|nr:hypothetical protein HHK36_007837 [Tetracentron sinense]